MTAGVEFREIEAAETPAARAEVFAFALEEYQTQGDSWRRLRQQDPPPAGLKPAPPTYDECLAMSRRIRLKRERQATHFNDTTNPYA